jgi:lipid II:glycine glycyltransferase (peptidoglycan interpeptide bridge formation enzyme)
VLADLQEIAVRSGALFLKVDPDVPAAYGIPGEEATASDVLGARVQRHLNEAGWLSAERVQFRSTLVLDLRPSETELLANMKSKTRYNLRLAARRGVSVRRGGEADLDLLYQLYAETSVRDGFVIRPEAYYHDVWGTFGSAGLAQPLVAELDGEPIAGLIVFRYGRTAYYLYGMSRLAHREVMPNYALQWEAIRWAREQGCLRYDLWGAPDATDTRDPLWGVYRFKVGLGGRAVQWIGAWDFPTRRALYWLTTRLMPRVLGLLRSRQMARTRALVE